jgi:hypothetical protein
MLRNATVILAILLILGSFSLSASAFARDGGYPAGGAGLGARGDNFGGGFGGTPDDGYDGYVTAPAVCVANSAGTVAAMYGATGAPITGP